MKESWNHLISPVLKEKKQQRKVGYLWSFLIILILQMRKEEGYTMGSLPTTCMYNHEDDVGSQRKSYELALQRWELGWSRCSSGEGNWPGLACPTDSQHLQGGLAHGRSLEMLADSKIKHSTSQSCSGSSTRKCMQDVYILAQRGPLINTNWTWVLTH